MSPASLEQFAPVLARLGPDASRHYGRSVSISCDALQDRPFSYVLRVAVHARGTPVPLSHLFVKLYKRAALNGNLVALRDRVERDFRTTQQVHRSMQQYLDVGVVPPVACYPDLFAIVTEQVEGRTLLEVLKANAKWFPSNAALNGLQETMAAAGRWIRVFQSGEQGTGLVTIDSLRAYIDHRLKQLVAPRRRSFTGEHRLAVLRHIDWLGQQVAEAELREVPIHADMALGNIIISGRRVVALDFAMASRGLRLHDLTRVAVQLNLFANKPHYRVRTLRTLEQALLAGFDPKLTMSAPLFRLLTLLHRVNHLTTLSAARTGFAEGVYNSVVRRQHRRWIDDEIRSRTGTERT